MPASQAMWLNAVGCTSHLTHVKDLADDISSMAGLQEQLLRSKTMKHCATIKKKKESLSAFWI